MGLKPPATAELRNRPRAWAMTGAPFMLVGGVLLVTNTGLALRVLGLFVLATGAKAVEAGVKLQFGGDPAIGKPPVRLILVNVMILVTLGVARLMGTWR